MKDSQPLLSTAQIAKSYGPVVALKSVDFSVRPGEIHALLGANGAGKSTLVKILAGVQSADAGTVQVNGQSMRFRNPAASMAAGIATVFQDPALIPDLNVEQNLRDAIPGAQLLDFEQGVGHAGSFFSNVLPLPK